MLIFSLSFVEYVFSSDKITDKFMNISKIILNLIFLTGTLSLFNPNLNLSASEQIHNSENDSIRILETQFLQFENEFYRTCSQDSTQFEDGIRLLEHLIDNLLEIDADSSENSAHQKAFTYLEKLKSLKLFHRFLYTAFSDSERSRYCQYFEKNYQWQLASFEKNPREHSIETNEEIRDKNNIKSEIFLPPLDDLHHNLSRFLALQRPVTVDFLQQHYLNGHEALIDYWVRRNKIYAFIVTVDSFYTTKWHASHASSIDDLKTKAQQLISPLTGTQNLLRLEFDVHLAHQLYLDLFKPIEFYIEKYQVLLVIPDDFLCGFPFEALVTDTTIEKKIDENIYYHQYSKIHYLTNKYAFTYNASISAILPVSPHRFSPNKLGRRLLTMSEPIIDSTGLSSIPTHDTSFLLQSSDFTSDEIRRVSRLLWRHDNLKKEQVTKNKFLNIGNNYRWIYLSQPSFLYNINPMKSGIFFSPDSMHLSNWLSAGEITRSFLTADMLTLSNSKLATNYETENPGVYALPLSFLFSGVKSVVYSLWDIHSISTSQFMSKFYWELKYKRQTNAQALQEAKIASMKDVLEFSGTQISKAHPYFWASFQLIGNPKIRPPSTTKISYWGVIIIVYVVVIVAALIITRKTLPARRV